MSDSRDHIEPPKLAEGLLTRLIRNDLSEEVLGDLEENFYTAAKDRSLFRAKLNYWYQVINYLRPFAIRKSRSKNSNINVMYRNYFKIAWRSLVKQRMYSSIKIGGLGIGVAACLLIGLYINDELSYDQHFPEKERIYRLALEYNFEGKQGRNVYLQELYARKVKEEVSGVEMAARIRVANSMEIRPAENKRSMHEEHIAYFDQELLDILQPKILAGKLESALRAPNSIVISESKSAQYFPEGDALGKTLILNNNTGEPYVIRGVIEDFPRNCHLDYNFLITLKGNEYSSEGPENWTSTNYFTYVKLAASVDASQTESRLDEIMLKYWAAIAGRMNIAPEKMGEIMTHHLQPVTDIHLKSNELEDGVAHGDIQLIWMFGGVAGFILLLACINFINLSTAKSANRAKEVGLRKTLGSLKSHLIQQFLTESVLFSFLAFAVGVALAWLTLPFFNVLSGKALIFPWMNTWFIPSILLAAFITGLLAGVYPSFYLSFFKPIQVLKGNFSRGNKNSILRSGLVVFQFAASIVLIIGTIAVNRQMNFILTKKVGFEKDQIITLQGTKTLGESIKPFKTELLKLGGVERVSISDYLPTTGVESRRDQNPFWNEGKQNDERAVSGQFWRVDEDYLQAMGMKLMAGRDFSDEIGNNKGKILVNETMVKNLGLGDPIGKRITNGKLYEIVGVLQDFHFQSFREDIGGLCMVLGESNSAMAIRVNADNMTDVLTSINGVWDNFSPDQNFRYQFLDERFAIMYQEVQRTGSLLTVFSLLAIIVACLGLFGLSTFIAEQRSKEVSIRKVLGASVKSVLSLLTLDFMKLVFLSIIVASPIAWYLMQHWLEDFAYRITINGWFFAVAGILVIAIALITVSGQALKVALSNPVDHLKGE